MGVLVQCFMLSLFVKSHIFISVITIPKMDYNDDLADAFSRFINVSTPVLTNISSCLWISLDFEDLGSVWLSENKTKYFTTSHFSMGKYLRMGGNSIRYEFPKDFFVPDQWLFCSQ